MRTKLLAAVAALSLGLSVAGASAGDLPYPNITDTSHASADAIAFFRSFFTAKSNHDATKLMTHFSKKNAYYIDASSGSVWPSWTSLNTLFQAFLPGRPANALSYPLRVIGGNHSALVSFVDTPTLFGRELRILGSVTFDDDMNVIRWIDYWDGRTAGTTNTIKSTYPTDFRDSEEYASKLIVSTAEDLQSFFKAGDVTDAVAMFSDDVVYEDMALHAQINGKLATTRYLTRALPNVPYGVGASLVHVEGSNMGGGYEWTANAGASPMKRGHTALELDADGVITRVTVIYDSSLLTTTTYDTLVGLSAE